MSATQTVSQYQADLTPFFPQLATEVVDSILDLIEFAQKTEKKKDEEEKKKKEQGKTRPKPDGDEFLTIKAQFDQATLDGIGQSAGAAAQTLVVNLLNYTQEMLDYLQAIADSEV